MPFSTKDTELLGHLTRRLGSDHQAEAEAARERINQLLGRHGLNFNDYAEWVEAGALSEGDAEPRRENAELRNEIVRLREAAADLEVELSSLRGSGGRQMVTTGAPPWTGAGQRRRGRRTGLLRTAAFSFLAALPIGWFLSGLHLPMPARPAATVPARDILPTSPRTERMASAFPARSGEEADPATSGEWKPPVGSRLATVLDNAAVLSTPFPSRATEQPVGRGSRVAVLRQLVANGRQWAEVSSPGVSGYIPLDQLDLQD